jgi:hypothetical protein
MPSIGDALEEALYSVERLRRLLTKSKTKQVSSGEEQSVIKATALAWFKSCRPLLARLPMGDLLQEADSRYQAILEAATRATSRSRYVQELKVLKAALVKLRSETLILTTSGAFAEPSAPTPLNYSRLIPDPAMQAILSRRWIEAWSCIEAKAYLAATVMMGALLEALLLARINRLADKSPVFASKCAPKDKAGKARPLQEWTLNSYIDVSHDLGWIGKASRDIGVVLRDYRNFIHPEKELSQGVSVGEADCRMFGAVLSALADQIIRS